MVTKSSLTTATALEAPSRATDAELLAASARGDQPSFSQLVERYYDAVYAVILRMVRRGSEAEDIVQDTFLKLWSNPQQVRDAGALKAWLMRVAINLLNDRHRKALPAESDTVELVADDRPTAEDKLAQTWAQSRLERALLSLPDRQRLAVALVHFEHMGNAAAAAALELSVDAFESLLARARRALKQELAADKDMLFAGLAMEGQGS